MRIVKVLNIFSFSIGSQEILCCKIWPRMTLSVALAKSQHCPFFYDISEIRTSQVSLRDSLLFLKCFDELWCLLSSYRILPSGVRNSDQVNEISVSYEVTEGF